MAKRKSLAETAKALKDAPSDRKPRFDVSDRGGESTIWAVGSAVRTVSDAIAKAEIDLRLWDITEKTVNSWPTSMMGKDGKPEQVWNWQVKVKLKRKAPKPVTDAIQELLKEFRSKPPKLPAVKRSKVVKEPHLLELALFDAHFGKLCWGLETGTNYDLKIAERVYVEAVEELLAKTAGYNVERILVPVGNDFFNADGFQPMTSHGTVVESVDDRFQKVFKSGCKALTFLIERCREIADVELLWVPGNHDQATSWFLIEWLAARFNGAEGVVFDTGPACRKYRRYGVTLLGFTHGRDEKHSELPLIMAAEVPQLWSETTHREVHLGHFHKAKQMSHLATDEFGGVRVRVLPSLSGVDSWHYGKGYVKNVRAAEAYLWSAEHGYTGHFTSVVRESK